ncbi:adenosylcobalamin-dependent ribonucleoside-diphosphate reductase, partial [Candidatus Woesearchaeota archaeon]|nr:adenosylcobalamin-dependent ribonucleoside-diphosphate reductase [Candidatus Woesearchaeota archaeon]
LGYFATEEDKQAFADELKWLQINRRFAFNSPVQFNAGIFHEYEVTGSKGINYYRYPKTGEVKKIKGGNNIYPQCHACFIRGPIDNLESIAMQGVDETGIFSSGSGIGQDIGVLRGSGESLSGGGFASGPVSFWRVYDAFAGTIKSGGKSRRAARMGIMRYKHPDIMEFIRSKVREDRKAKILMENGYSGGMEGEATMTVAFQNTNISVRLDDEFFDTLAKKGEVELRNVKDGSVAGKVSAEKMLQEIAFGSWRVGDPAVQYETKIQEMHTSKNSGRINSSNPCSEYMFLDDTSCNLNSHNLLAYTDEKGNFDIDAFKRAVLLTTIAADIINDAASYPVRDIAEISPEFRTTGVGYANLGALLMRKGIPYDSEKGRAIAGAITALMTGTAYEASADMAEKLGTFIHFEFNKKPMMEVMERHRKNLEGILWKEHVPGSLMNAACISWNRVIERGKEVGFRNAQTTVLAPTGTIAYLMGCDTTGVEPAISLKIKKNLAGGGTLNLANREVENALKNLGYSPSEIKEISEYIGEKNTVRDAPHIKPEHLSIFDTAFGNEDGVGAIPFEGHVKMLGAVQPFLSGAVSKTCNLPDNATVKDIHDGYLLGHRLGLKAMAVFRNNSKAVSALDFGDNEKIVFRRGEKEDLPYQRKGFEEEVRIGGSPFHIIVSEYPDGRPGQILFAAYKEGGPLKSLFTVEGISASKALKRGVSLEDVVDSWIGQGFEPNGFITIERKGKTEPHPYIKTASSALDFAAKLLLLQYMGRTDLVTDIVTEPDKVKLEELWGFSNGAMLYYAREGIDEWDFEQVIRDPILGGFVKDEKIESLLKKRNGKPKHNNPRGLTCKACGNLLTQYAPNCYKCDRCGEGSGGCGQ